MLIKHTPYFFIKEIMAQIKKHAGGGTASLAQKPVDAPPIATNKLKFTVDGQEHEMDETDFNAIAEQAFSNEVRKGQAKLRDRGKWMQEFNVKLNEAKTGRFNIQSSGDSVGSISYQPQDGAYDASAHDGMGDDGQVAQRSGLGNILAPRAAGSNDRMAAVLNTYIGEGVVANRKSFMQTQADKAAADKATATSDYEGSVSRDAQTLLNPSLGRIAYGGDWDNEEARKVILQKHWGKEVGHVAKMDQAFQKHVGRIFDSYYDGKESDYLKAGVDIKALREKYSSVYDPTTKSFKTPLKGITDLYRYADTLDSVATDSPLFSKDAYNNYINGVSGTNPAATGNATTAEGETPAAATTPGRTVAGQVGGLFKGSDDRFYADKDLKRTVNGKWNDGKYYDHGYLRVGKYAPMVGGKFDYYAKDTGFYADGVKVDQGAFDQYLEKLAADKTRSNDYTRALKNNEHVDKKYADDNFIRMMTDGFVNDANITNHGEYAFKGFGAEFKPAGATNLSPMFKDRQGQPIKGGIYGFQSTAKNHLGVPDAETAVLTDDGYNYRGVMRRGQDGKFRMYSKQADHTLIENKDPKLRAFLDNIGDADDSRWNEKDGYNMLLNRSRFAPSERAPITTASKDSATPFMDLLLKPMKYQLGGSLSKKQAPANDPNKIKNNTKTTYAPSKISNVLKGDYEMGTQELLEAGALAADLTGVVLSMSGAGSIAAGATGAAGTIAQFGADWKRDGLDSGDIGRGLVGLGLDAASAIPGLGIVAKGGKTLKSVQRSAKYLLPALGAVGATRAAGLLADVATGKKKLTDLNMDDMRTLTNGIHGAMGASRTINNRVAVKRGETSSLALKSGSVDLDPKQVSALNKLSGEDKLTQAKLFAIENLGKQGKNVSDVELKNVRDGLKSKTLNRLPFTADGKVKEIVDIKTESGGFQLKDVGDFQGNSLKDKYMRWAIDKAAIRNPSLAAPALEGTRASRWGILGDYTRSNGKAQRNTLETTPEEVTRPMLQLGPGRAPNNDGAYTPYNIGGMYSKLSGASTTSPNRLLPEGRPVTQGPAMAMPSEGGFPGRVTDYSVNGMYSRVSDRVPVRLALNASRTMKLLNAGPAPTQGPAFPLGASYKPIKPRIRIRGDASEIRKTGFEYNENNSPVTLNPRRALPIGRVVSEGPGIPMGAEKVQNLRGEYVPAGGQSSYGVNANNSSTLLSPRRALQRGPLLMNPSSIEQSKNSIYRGGKDAPKESIKKSKATRKPSSTSKKTSKKDKPKDKGNGQMSAFKNGGQIQKALFGTKLNQLGNVGANPLVSYNAAPSNSLTSNIKITAPLTKLPIKPATGPRTLGMAETPEGNWVQKVKGYLSGVNKNDLSEFGRAMATRAVNKSIDTRVEAPMISAPTEVSVPIQGDLLAKSAFANRAADTRQMASRAFTSDGMLHTAQNLSAAKYADGLQLQGDMQNVEALNKSRAMNLQNTMQNNSVRSEVANRNIGTLANAKQAERAAENQKIGLVAQPLLTFWENKNAENLRKEAQANQIDNQIALSSLSTTLGDMRTPLNKRATELYSNSLNTKYSEIERKKFSEQYESVQKQIEGLGTAGKNHALQMMKDRKYVAPTDYYKPYLKPLYASGGSMSKAINSANKDAYKERLKSIKEELKADGQATNMSLKEIQKLINKVLKIK